MATHKKGRKTAKTGSVFRKCAGCKSPVACTKARACKKKAGY